MKKTHIVIINGSLHGDTPNSNTFRLLKLAEKDLQRRRIKVTFISPEQVKYKFRGTFGAQSAYILRTDKILAALAKADGLIIGTGTYWGQCSSTLQKFLEEATPSEGTDIWLGKPVGIIVSEHSAGGLTVLSNLLTTLSNLGCMAPPQSGMVYSRTGQETKKKNTKWMRDIWGVDDIAAICDKVAAYAAVRERTGTLKSWPIDQDSLEWNKRWVS